MTLLLIAVLVVFGGALAWMYAKRSAEFNAGLTELGDDAEGLAKLGLDVLLGLYEKTVIPLFVFMAGGQIALVVVTVIGCDLMQFKSLSWSSVLTVLVVSAACIAALVFAIRGRAIQLVIDPVDGDLREREDGDAVTLVTQREIRRASLRVLLATIVGTAVIMAVACFTVGLFDINKPLRLAGILHALAAIAAIEALVRSFGFVVKSAVAGTEFSIKTVLDIVGSFMGAGAKAVLKKFERPNIANEDEIDPAIRSTFMGIKVALLTLCAPMLGFDHPVWMLILVVLVVISMTSVMLLDFVYGKFKYEWAKSWAERMRKSGVVFQIGVLTLAGVAFVIDVVMQAFAPEAYTRITNAGWFAEQKMLGETATQIEKVAGITQPGVEQVVETDSGNSVFASVANFFSLTGWQAGWVLLLAVVVFCLVFPWEKEAKLEKLRKFIGVAFAAMALVAVMNLMWMAKNSSAPDMSFNWPSWSWGKSRSAQPAAPPASRAATTRPYTTDDDDGREEMAKGKSNPALEEYCRRHDCVGGKKK